MTASRLSHDHENRHPSSLTRNEHGISLESPASLTATARDCRELQAPESHGSLARQRPESQSHAPIGEMVRHRPTRRPPAGRRPIDCRFAWVTVAGAWLLSRVEHRWMWAMLAAQLTTGVVLQAVLVGIF